MPQNKLKTYKVTTTKKDFVIAAESFAGNQNFTAFVVGTVQIATFNNIHLVAIEDMEAMSASAPPEPKKKKE